MKFSDSLLIYQCHQNLQQCIFNELAPLYKAACFFPKKRCRTFWQRHLNMCPLKACIINSQNYNRNNFDVIFATLQLNWPALKI